MLALLASPLARYAGIGLVALVAVGGAYLKGRGDGRDAEAIVWQKAVADLQANAARLLAEETAKTLAKERELTALTAKVEADHVAATAALDAAGAKYNRLGKLFEQTRARCGGGSSGPIGANPAAAAVDHERDDPRAIVPGPADETLGTIAADADRMRLGFKACQEYVREVARALK